MKGNARHYIKEIHFEIYKNNGQKVYLELTLETEGRQHRGMIILAAEKWRKYKAAGFVYY